VNGWMESVFPVSSTQNSTTTPCPSDVPGDLQGVANTPGDQSRVAGQPNGQGGVHKPISADFLEGYHVVLRRVCEDT